MQGYIKDWRKELESDIWLMPPLYHRVWQWIKYNVNHKPEFVPFSDGTKVLVKPGERITSYRQIAKGVGYYERGVWREPNVKTIKTILDWLETEHMIAIESNSKYTLIKVLNWGIYQEPESDESNTQETANQQSLDTNKNDKNEKNDKKNKVNKIVTNKFDDDSPEMQLARHLREEILKQDPNTKVPDDLKQWAIEAERMIRIDKRDPAEAFWLITWAQNNTFWRANILSMSKFRKQYDTLKRQAASQGAKSSQRYPPKQTKNTALNMLREEIVREQNVVIDIRGWD